MGQKATPSDKGGSIEETKAVTLKSRRTTLKQAAPIVCLIGGLVLAALVAQNVSSWHHNATSGDSPDNSAPTQRWTKTEFIKLVAGRTKAQIRAEFGSPDSVEGSEWLYFHLPVYDDNAGTQASSTAITFGSGWTLMLQLFNRQCVDQDALNEDCANEVHFN